jgi:hypothetical protein
MSWKTGRRDFDSCRWGETTSLNCGHQRTYCSFPRWHMSTENHGGILVLTEENWFVHWSFLAVLPAESFGSKQEERAKGMRIWHCEVFVFILGSDILHAAKFTTWGPRLYFPCEVRKEGVLRIFIASKNPTLLPGLNPLFLGSLVSTLPITPPRQSVGTSVCAKEIQ